MLGIRKIKLGKDEKGLWCTYLGHEKIRTVKTFVMEYKYARRVDKHKMLQAHVMNDLKKEVNKVAKASKLGFNITIDDKNKIYKFEYCKHRETGRYAFTWTYDSEYEMYTSVLRSIVIKPIRFPLSK